MRVCPRLRRDILVPPWCACACPRPRVSTVVTHQVLLPKASTCRVKAPRQVSGHHSVVLLLRPLYLPVQGFLRSGDALLSSKKQASCLENARRRWAPWRRLSGSAARTAPTASTIHAAPSEFFQHPTSFSGLLIDIPGSANLKTVVKNEATLCWFCVCMCVFCEFCVCVCPSLHPVTVSSTLGPRHRKSGVLEGWGLRNK